LLILLLDLNQSTLVHRSPL